MLRRCRSGRASNVVESRVLHQSRQEIQDTGLTLSLTGTGGLRLDECAESIRDAVHGVLQASLSADGYAKVLGCCLVNGFLGELLDGRKVMNEHSYNFRLFGVPDCEQPWAFTFFGHHLCIA